jgi:hypothetical protein
MDDANISSRQPAMHGASEAKNEANRERFQTLTEACSVMKDELASEAQHIIGGKEQLGKPPTITEACSVIKDQIGSEARQILSNPDGAVKQPTGTEVCDSIQTEIIGSNVEAQKLPAAIAPDRSGGTSPGFMSEDADTHFYLHPIEQAQKAIREAQWFEQ